MTLHLTFLGGAGTVTGSKTLVETDAACVLVDCGLFQGFKHLRLKNRSPLQVPPSSIGAVLLTHAHLDHSGWLPVLVRRPRQVLLNHGEPEGSDASRQRLERDLGLPARVVLEHDRIEVPASATTSSGAPPLRAGTQEAPL